MSQLTFAEAEYAIKKRKTSRELFLEKLLPWKQLEAPIIKHYARGGVGRPPYPLSTMLRVHIMQERGIAGARVPSRSSPGIGRSCSFSIPVCR